MMREKKTTTLKITTVLCDLDGTLVDSSRDIAESFQHAWRLVTGETPPAGHHIIRQIGKPLATMVRDLGYCFSPQRLASFLEIYRQHYAKRSARFTRPYAGVETTLLKLSPRSLGVVTTKLQEQAEGVLRQLNLLTYFGHVQGSVPGLRLKPAPDLIHAALENLQCPPQQALMVGDTTADIEAGKAAGVRTCAVTYGFGRTEELRRHQPDFCIASFRELPGIVSQRAPVCTLRRGW